ncbi:MAG: NADH-quinone oxidoreductase subunit H [Campylobacterales bacterium]|nr:NADH-quinone oxidoreductase subunit H [Campylobacterales bacterium]
MLLLDLLLMLLIAYGFGFLYYGLYRNLSARVHGRFGPSLAQSFSDSIKLFVKEESTTFGWMFYLGPVIMASGAVLNVLFIPFLNQGESLQGLSSYGNLIVVLYLMVLGPLGNALGVGSSGNPFGVMGVTRGLTRLLALELPFYLAAIGVMIDAGSADFGIIMQAQSTQSNMFAHPLLFAAAFISFLGFMGKSPFDVVGAPQEVYSGPATEFSGKFLALLMSQSAMFSFAKLLLMVNLFWGGADHLGELVAKTFVLFVAATFIGSVYARFSTVQSVEFLIRIPTLLGIVGLALL